MPRLPLMAILLAGSIGRVCLAQSAPTPAPPEQSQPSSATASASTAKSPTANKVWTNDNLTQARGSISVVGDKRNQKPEGSQPKPADPGAVARIRQDLQKLQSQLDDLNKKLISFKDFQQGETVTTGTDENSTAYTRTPVNQQISALEQKKKKLEAQIDALEDEARKKGILPGQLR
jgi:hypothetical protein